MRRLKRSVFCGVGSNLFGSRARHGAGAVEKKLVNKLNKIGSSEVFFII